MSLAAARIEEKLVRSREDRDVRDLPVLSGWVSDSNKTQSVRIIEVFLTPVTIAVVTIIVGLWDRGSAPGAYTILAALSAALSALVFGRTRIFVPSLRRATRETASIMLRWGVVVCSLILLGNLAHAFRFFSPSMLSLWLFLTPVSLTLVHIAASSALMAASKFGRPSRTAVIVGANGLGVALEQRIAAQPLLGMTVRGFFDDRTDARLSERGRARHLGVLHDLPRYVNEHSISDVYICLPVIWHDRISELLSGLDDTTASIYFVPDIYMHDLMQSRVDVSLGIPALVLVDTPFLGFRALSKRLMDVVIAALALVTLFPVMIMCGLAVKLSSPGPVFFRQKRYGMGGQDICVLKFRTMYVQDEGGDVVQAIRNDPRVTKIGHFLRRSSIDELPQLVNVLRGEMSLVGPRPHAVYHNEMYRTVISKYMVRHKVKPGITGLAQVRGLRGETDTLDKMEARVKCDLEYIRSWSLELDIWIMVKTIKIMMYDRAAF